MSVYDTSEWAGFVAAVRADPADDTRRLVAADWLDEHGEPERAEYIREFVAQERAAWDDPDRLARAIRINDLYRKFGPSLWAAWSAANPGMDRGFVTEMACPIADWLARGDDLYRREPVRAVRLTTWPVLEQVYMSLSGYTMRLAGRGAGRAFRWGTLTSEVTAALLADAWPGVDFGLPPALDPATWPTMTPEFRAAAGL